MTVLTRISRSRIAVALTAGVATAAAALTLNSPVVLGNGTWVF